MHPNNPNQFTEEAWDTLLNAIDMVKQAQQQALESEHLMRSLLEHEEAERTIVHKLGVNAKQLRDYDEFIHPQPKVSNVTSVYLGRFLDTLLDRAEDFRKRYDDELFPLSIYSCLL